MVESAMKQMVFRSIGFSEVAATMAITSATLCSVFHGPT
jgi:hypothetical protein